MLRSMLWLDSRKQLTKQVKQQVQRHLGETTEDISQYMANYRREFSGVWEKSSRLQLKKAIAQAEFVVGGEFHPFAQSQRSHLRILRAIDRRPMILALECFEAKDQKTIDKFMASNIDEAQFLQAIRWKKRWGFPWENYKPLVLHAKKQGIKVVGINRYFKARTPDSLHKRDLFSAQKILHWKLKHPETLMYVIYGNLHLAQSHLPKQLKSLIKQKAMAREYRWDRQILTLFQNSEKLYFQLAEKKMENKVEVLKSRKGRFCLIESPPWVKWQSYLLFLEESYDESLDEDDDFDFTDHMQLLIKMISQDLRLKIDFNDIAVYSPKSFTLWNSLQAKPSQYPKAIVSYLMSHDRSFYLPEGKRFYLSRPSINHAASLAGDYIQAELSGRQQLLWQMPNDFLPLIWLTGFSFFCSKLVNHKRKADTIDGLKKQLHLLGQDRRSQEPLLLALDQRMSEVVTLTSGRRREPLLQPKYEESYLLAARLLGQIFGDRIYQLYQDRKVLKKQILKWMSIDVNNSGFKKNYYDTIKFVEERL